MELAEMKAKSLEAAGNLGVPLTPVVPVRLSVKFVLEMVLVETGGKTADGLKKGFVVPGGQIDIRSLGWVGGLDKEEGVACFSRTASLWTKDCADSPPFSEAYGAQPPVGDVDGRAERGREHK